MKKEIVTTQIINNIQTIVDQYDAFLIDMWGVVYDGEMPYPGVIDAINQITARDKSIIFISNTPRPNQTVLEKLLHFGVNPRLLTVISSGDLVTTKLIALSALKKKLYHLGANRNKDLLRDLPITPTETLEAADILLLTAFAEEEEGADYYDAILEKALSLGLSMICANPDTLVSVGKKIRYCAGTFAKRYADKGGHVDYYGKPHANIYEAAFDRLHLQGLSDKSRFLMIGDTPETDILGAQNASIPSLLVLTGNMENRSLSTLGKLIPHWVIPSLQW